MRILRSMVTIVGVALVSLLYVHQQVELVKVSYAIELKEKALKDILDDNEGLGYNIDNLEAPNRLEEALLAKRIEVAFPKRGHVVRLAKSGRSGRSARPYILKEAKKPDIVAFFDSPSRNSPPLRVGMDSDRNSASAKFPLRRSEEKDSTGVSPWSFNTSVVPNRGL